MVSSRVGVCTHSQSEQCEALCVGTSHHYWSGREGVVIRTTTTTPSCPDHYCSSYKAVLLHTAPPLWRRATTTPMETIASYGTRFVVCDLRACSFTGGTPFALSLNALRLPHAAKSSKITSCACYFGDRATVSYGLSARATCLT